MHIYLETERLILRRFTEDDLDNLVELDSDPEVMRFISGGAPTPRDVYEHDYLPAYLDYYQRGDRYGFWAAVEKSSGEFLGWFHFRPGHGAGPDEPELGYRLRRSAWGKGYATEGSRALIDKGFAELCVRRVTASTYSENIGSRRVMEKAGMRFVRTFRYEPPEDDIHAAAMALWKADDVEYAIDRADWEQQEAAAAPGR